MSTISHFVIFNSNKVVRSKLRKECKCHGVTGSCNIKTCWKELAPFNVIGQELKKKYRSAVRVSFLNNKLHKRDNDRDRLVTRKQKKLVYLDSSPDYCARNATVGSPGMRGRTCASDIVPVEKCRSLCKSCNLRHRTVEHYKQVKCRCKFVWCCSVKCELCTVKYSRTTCMWRDGTILPLNSLGVGLYVHSFPCYCWNSLRHRTCKDSDILRRLFIEIFLSDLNFHNKLIIKIIVWALYSMAS